MTQYLQNPGFNSEGAKKNGRFNSAPCAVGNIENSQAVVKRKVLQSDNNFSERYQTASGQWIEGRRLKAFLAFWKAFNYPNGKAEAAEVWRNIRPATDPQHGMTTAFARLVIYAAGREAIAREEAKKCNRNYKNAASWLRARAWEDYEDEYREYLKKQATKVEQPQPKPVTDEDRKRTRLRPLAIKMALGFDLAPGELTPEVLECARAMSPDKDFSKYESLLQKPEIKEKPADVRPVAIGRALVHQTLKATGKREFARADSAENDQQMLARQSDLMKQAQALARMAASDKQNEFDFHAPADPDEAEVDEPDTQDCADRCPDEVDPDFETADTCPAGFADDLLPCEPQECDEILFAAPLPDNLEVPEWIREIDEAEEYARNCRQTSQQSDCANDRLVASPDHSVTANKKEKPVVRSNSCCAYSIREDDDLPPSCDLAAASQDCESVPCLPALPVASLDLPALACAILPARIETEKKEKPSGIPASLPGIDHVLTLLFADQSPDRQHTRINIKYTYISFFSYIFSSRVKRQEYISARARTRVCACTQARVRTCTGVSELPAIMDLPSFSAADLGLEWQDIAKSRINALIRRCKVGHGFTHAICISLPYRAIYGPAKGISTSVPQSVMLWAFVPALVHMRLCMRIRARGP